jgi:predicted DNA-binding ArsR family transcriptional regulator
MTQGEVINKLSMECAVALGDLDTLQTVRNYIQMALAIGVEHYTKDMEEVIVMNYNGEEIDRLKSVTDVERKLGIKQAYVSAVLRGDQFSAGGLRFQLVKDKELVPVKKIA